MDKEHKVGMTPAPVPVELKSDNVKDSLRLECSESESDNIMLYKTVNGHMKAQKKCHSEVLQSTKLQSEACNDGSGDAISLKCVEQIHRDLSGNEGDYSSFIKQQQQHIKMNGDSLTSMDEIDNSELVNGDSSLDKSEILNSLQVEQKVVKSSWISSDETSSDEINASIDNLEGGCLRKAFKKALKGEAVEFSDLVPNPNISIETRSNLVENNLDISNQQIECSIEETCEIDLNNISLEQEVDGNSKEKLDESCLENESLQTLIKKIANEAPLEKGELQSCKPLCDDFQSSFDKHQTKKISASLGDIDKLLSDSFGLISNETPLDVKSKSERKQMLGDNRTSAIMDEVNNSLENTLVVKPVQLMDVTTKKEEAKNVCVEPLSTRTGVVMKDLKYFQRQNDDYLTDESSDDESSCFYSLRKTFRPQSTIKKNDLSVPQSEEQPQIRSRFKKPETMIDFGGKISELSSLVSWLQSEQGKMKNLAAELQPVLQDLRKQKFCLGDPFANVTSVSAGEHCKKRTMELNSEKKDLERHSELDQQSESVHDWTKVAARCRPITHFPKRKHLRYRVKKATRMEDSAYYRHDGKYTGKLNKTFAQWTSELNPSYHPVLDKISDIPLECLVNTVVSNGVGWWKDTGMWQGVEKKREEKEKKKRNIDLAKVGIFPDANFHNPTSGEDNDAANDRLKPRNHPNDREPRKRRQSTPSTDSKRMRAMSGDSDLDTPSGSSTPTNNTDPNSQLRRKRHPEGLQCMENTNKVERLKYKDIQTPSWKKVDVKAALLLISNGGRTTHDASEIEHEKADLTESSYGLRHQQYEVLEKKKYVAYMEWNRKNKKNGGNNRAGNRANLPSIGDDCEVTSSPPSTFLSTIDASMIQSTPVHIGTPCTPPPPSSSDINVLSVPYHQSSYRYHDDVFQYWETRAFPLNEHDNEKLTTVLENTKRRLHLKYIKFRHLESSILEKLVLEDTNTAIKWPRQVQHLRKRKKHRNAGGTATPVSARKHSSGSSSHQKPRARGRKRKTSWRDLPDDCIANGGGNRSDCESVQSEEYDSDETLTGSERGDDDNVSEQLHRDQG